jgi:8-oxo-dGTP pyrophosphatase MutT (NUDIX family)
VTEPGAPRVGAGAPVPDDAAAEAAPVDERVVASRVLHRGRYLTFRVDSVERPDGSRAERDIVGHPGAVAIVAIDGDDRVLLVRQFRLATGRRLLEIPAGTLEVAPDGSIESPDLAAPRELEEETGQVATSWRGLGSFWTAPGFATEEMHLYLATGLRKVRDQLGEDDDERLELERIPFPDAVAMAEDGTLEDAKTLVGLLRVARLRDREPGSAGG